MTQEDCWIVNATGRTPETTTLSTCVRKPVSGALSDVRPSPELSSDETMRLGDFCSYLNGVECRQFADVPISDVTCDSRQVRSGSLFVAIPGARQDGHRYVRDALARGAVAVVAERDIQLPRPVPLLIVKNARRAAAALAATFHGYPSHDLDVFGVTGTNGKSTVVFELRAILEADGRAVCVLGTVHYRIGERVIPARETTPGPFDLQAYLAEARDLGAGVAVMEVSSHGLAQHRPDYTRFRCGLFTNLTHDHQDFHGSMEAYLDAKARLFEMLDVEASAVINIDDPAGQALLHRTRGVVLTYAFDRPADYRGKVMSNDFSGMEIDVQAPDGTHRLRTPLFGTHNAYNVLAAVAAARSVGVPMNAVIQGVEAMKGVPGRLELVADKPARVYVDYAHTPDALRTMLESVRGLSPRRLIVVFGCGGDRDRAKRPKMGDIATQIADETWLTSDNPRSEDPADILADVQLGIAGDCCFHVELDRKAAIRAALENAGDGDAVIIAGKGHETYQVFSNSVVTFDDRLVAREALAELGKLDQDDGWTG